MGKSNPAHRAGAPTARGQWVSPRPVGESDILIATGGGPPTGRGHLVLPPTGGWMSGSAHRQTQPACASSSCIIIIIIIIMYYEIIDMKI